MATTVYTSKCKWCGVIVDSKKPIEVCECCGSTDIDSISYAIEGEFPKTYKEQKLEAKEKAAKARQKKIITLAKIGIGTAIAIGAILIILF